MNFRLVSIKSAKEQDKIKASFFLSEGVVSEEIIKFLNNGGLITKYLNPIWAAGAKVSDYEDNLLD